LNKRDAEKGEREWVRKKRTKKKKKEQRRKGKEKEKGGIKTEENYNQVRHLLRKPEKRTPTPNQTKRGRKNWGGCPAGQRRVKKSAAQLPFIHRGEKTMGKKRGGLGNPSVGFQREPTKKRI